MSEKEMLERLIDDIELMTDSQRLIFIELLLQSFRPHELSQFYGRFEKAAGQARLVKSTRLLKLVRTDPKS